MIAGGNWWRANEIVIRHLTRQAAARYRSRDRASLSHAVLSKTELNRHRPPIRARAHSSTHEIGHDPREHVDGQGQPRAVRHRRARSLVDNDDIDRGVIGLDHFERTADRIFAWRGIGRFDNIFFAATLTPDANIDSFDFERGPSYDPGDRCPVWSIARVCCLPSESESVELA